MKEYLSQADKIYNIGSIFLLNGSYCIFANIGYGEVCFINLFSGFRFCNPFKCDNNISHSRLIKLLGEIQIEYIGDSNNFLTIHDGYLKVNINE